MNDSAYQALIIGLNTFIFVIALTAGMALMSTINQMVELTKESIDTEVGGNLIKEYGDEAERTFTGAEVFAFYGQKLNGGLEDIAISVKTSGSESSIEEYGKNSGMNYLNRTFILKCISANSYLFELKAELD